MPTVSDLGKLVKEKYPGEYDDFTDHQLGLRVRSKFPGEYDDFELEKGGFEVGKLPDKEVSLGEATIRGSGQGFSLGGMPYVQGAIESVKQVLKGQEPTFSTNVELSRQQEKQAKEQHPVAYTGAEIVSTIPAAVVAGSIGAPAAGASLATKAKHAATVGAALGGTSAALKSEADNAQDFIGDVGIGTVVGGATGAALTPVGWALGKAGERIGQWFKDRTGRLVFKRLTGGLEPSSPKDIETGLDAYESGKLYPRAPFPGTPGKVAGARAAIETEKELLEQTPAVKQLKDIVQRARNLEELHAKGAQEQLSAFDKLAKARSTGGQSKALDKVAELENELEMLSSELADTHADMDPDVKMLYEEVVARLQAMKDALSKNTPTPVVPQIVKNIKEKVTESPLTALSNIPTYAAGALEKAAGLNPVMSPTVTAVAGRFAKGGFDAAGGAARSTAGQKLLADYLRQKAQEDNAQQSLKR